MAVGDDKRPALVSAFNNLLLPWKSLVYNELDNASNYGRTGGDTAAIFYLVDPNGKIRFKRVVQFGESTTATQNELNREIDKLCSEFGIARRK